MCATLSSQATDPRRYLPSIPLSKTWTALSTLQNLPTGHNNRLWNHQPTAIASTVQSKPYAPPPAPPIVNTGRTSVSRLRKSFEAPASQLGEEKEKSSFTRTSADLDMISLVRESVPAVSTEAMEVRKTRPSLEAPYEHTTEAPAGRAYISPVYSAVFRLKNPIWDSNDRRSNDSSPVHFPRRSKKSRGHSAKAAQSCKAAGPGKKVGDDPPEDDVSPTSNSAGPGTPRPAVSEPVAAAQDVVSSARPGELHLPTAKDLSNYTGETVQQESAQRTSKVAELRNIFDRRKYPAVPGDGPPHPPGDDIDARTVPGDLKQPQNASALRLKTSVATKETTSRRQVGNEDTGVPSTCTIFPKPFRRDLSTAMPLGSRSPVRERISILEGLIKPGLNSPQVGRVDNKKLKQDRSQSRYFLTGNSISNKKKISVDWLPKPFRKLSFHLGKSIGQPDSDARGTEKANERGGSNWKANIKEEAVKQPTAVGNHMTQQSSRSGEPSSNPQIHH